MNVKNDLPIFTIITGRVKSGMHSGQLNRTEMKHAVRGLSKLNFN